MLDKNKVKLMTELAMYEQNEGKEDLKLCEYYRKDYVSLHTICSLIWTTIGYGLLVGIIFIVCMDYLLGHMTGVIVLLLIGVIGFGFLFLLVLYGVITAHVFSERHKAATRRLKVYNRKLIRLLKMYKKEKR